MAKLGGDQKVNSFKAVVDLVDHEKLQMKCDTSARGMAEEMLTFQFLVNVLVIFFLSFNNHFLSNAVSFRLQGFLRSLFIYCYFRKVLTTDEGVEDLKKRLADAEEKNAKLKEAVAKKEEDLLVLGQHLVVMECEASDAFKARDRVKSKLAK
jgi:hypothetical protein